MDIKIKRNPNINKLSIATSHLGDSKSLSYWIKPTISYFGINLERVKDIHAVQAIKPYTNKMIAMKEGPKTILGKCFSSQFVIIYKNNCSLKLKENSYLNFIYLLLSIALTSIATASLEDIFELK